MRHQAEAPQGDRRRTRHQAVAPENERAGAMCFRASASAELREARPVDIASGVVERSERTTLRN